MKGWGDYNNSRYQRQYQKQQTALPLPSASMIIRPSPLCARAPRVRCPVVTTILRTTYSGSTWHLQSCRQKCTARGGNAPLLAVVPPDFKAPTTVVWAECFGGKCHFVICFTIKFKPNFIRVLVFAKTVHCTKMRPCLFIGPHLTMINKFYLK